MSKPIFYEGQEVGCLILGEGVVTRIDATELSFPIKVSYKGFNDFYTLGGVYVDEGRPTLYPIDQYREIIANLPAPQPEAWKPKVGEWCWFGKEKYKHSFLTLARFICINEHGQYAAEYMAGIANYDFCAPFTGELPEHLKEVQP